MSIELVAIEHEGPTAVQAREQEALMAEIVQQTVQLYDRVGYQPPWIGYLATRQGQWVGTCSFKGPPQDGRIELAYFTLPAVEGQGVATAMAAELIRLSQQSDNTLQITAQTLPQRSASHRILEKLNFQHVATLNHSTDGEAWEW
ncbi:MAG: hypothetical protein HJJLKODD_00471 [Phycisphaerae bacterium]|nr:hypothetical protein [Phycisphaerae bacterium]